MFTSVTGLFSFNVRVCEPLAYEPPTIATVAVWAVRNMSSKSPSVDGTGFADGKFVATATDSMVPLTEIGADVGGGDGGVGGVGGVAGGDLGPEPDEPLLPLPDEPDFDAEEANGSLVSKRENDSSCPGSAVGVTTATSCDESVLEVVEVESDVAAAAGSGVPASDGATGVADDATGDGVDAGVTGVAGAACGIDEGDPEPLSDDIVLIAYAIATARNTTSRITIFFCLAALSFAASAGFFRRFMCCSFRRRGSGRDVVRGRRS